MMLQTINERIQGWVAWTIIIIIALTFVLFGANYYVSQRAANQHKALVNGEPISTEQWDLTYRRLKRQANLATVSEEQLKSKAATMLINDALTRQAAISNGFVVTKKQAEGVALTFSEFQQDGQFSDSLFKTRLSQSLFTPLAFIKQIQLGLLSNQMRFSFSGTDFSLPNEQSAHVALTDQSRDYRYLLVDSDKFKSQKAISQQAIEEYYHAHKKDFMSKERVSIEYIQLSMKDLMAGIKVSDAQLKGFYNENKANYLRPARYTLAHILLRLPANATDKEQQAVNKKVAEIKLALTQGTAFSHLAKKYSADLLSADGVLPEITAGSLGPVFEKQLVNLKPMQVSLPFRTDQGIEIIKLLKKQNPSSVPFDDVKATIHTTLVSEQAQQLFNLQAEQLADLSYQNPESLKAVAKAMKLSLKSTPEFSRKGLTKGAPSNKQFVNTAFSQEVLVHGDNSQPFQLNSDSLVVMRKKRHVAAALLPLATVKSQIASRLTLMEAKRAAMAYAKQLQQRLAASKPVIPLLKEQGIDWVSVKDAKRYNNQVNSQLNHLAFTLGTGDSFKTKQLSNGNVVIVELLAVRDGKLSALDKSQRKALNEQLAASFGLRDYSLYMDYFKQSATIEKQA